MIPCSISSGGIAPGRSCVRKEMSAKNLGPLSVLQRCDLLPFLEDVLKLGLGGSAIGWALGAVGYNAKLEVAPAATKMAIYGFSIVIPLVTLIVMFILLSRFDLEARLPKMREEMEERRKAQA